MIENEDGTVSGSLNRARIKELHDQASDPEKKAYYRGLLGDSEEGRAIDDESGSEDMSKLRKAELAEKAEKAGVETKGKTKAELADSLKKSEADSGNNNAS